MKVTIDTNVLVRAVVRDHPDQAAAADKVLREASLIAISLPCLCEFVWVLRRAYGFDQSSCAAAIRALLDVGNVVLNRPAVEAGLSILEVGGDFADGVMVHEGKWLGGETFLSFDKKAVSLLKKASELARILD